MRTTCHTRSHEGCPWDQSEQTGDVGGSLVVSVSRGWGAAWFCRRLWLACVYNSMDRYSTKTQYSGITRNCAWLVPLIRRVVGWGPYLWEQSKEDSLLALLDVKAACDIDLCSQRETWKSILFLYNWNSSFVFKRTLISDPECKLHFSRSCIKIVGLFLDHQQESWACYVQLEMIYKLQFKLHFSWNILIEKEYNHMRDNLGSMEKKTYS